jgi:hypothetical protein
MPTTISTRDEEDRDKNNSNGDPAAPATTDGGDEAEQTVRADNQGPTKPLRLTLKERARLLAEAIGFKSRHQN